VPTWAPRCHRNIGRLPTARPRSTCCEIIHQRKPRHRLQLTVVIGDPLRGSVPIEYLASISDSVTGIQLTINYLARPERFELPTPWFVVILVRCSPLRLTALEYAVSMGYS